MRWRLEIWKQAIHTMSLLHFWKTFGSGYDDAPFSFYRMLLATPLPERFLLLRRSAIMLEDPDKRAFRTALLKAALVLNRR